MKWVTFRTGAGPHAGFVDGTDIVDLGPAPLQSWFGREEDARAGDGRRMPIADATLMQPIVRPGKILGIGVNYADHAKESVSFTNLKAGGVQKWFVKQATAANGPYDPVERPAVSTDLDYEGEIVVVIGKRARHVPASRAMEVVAGFCAGCDYSVRDWQKASPTVNMGKGFDTHAPFGPWIVTPDEIGPVTEIGVRSFVNGEQRQSGNAGQMIASIPEQIEHLSTAFTLEPGDVIFTGTPAGVGQAFDPPRFVSPGDVVRVEVDGVGYIENTIVQGDRQTVIE
ncbi:MAG: fumarylacetoacetate hydrolase family protein [Pseudomonadota bacterium]